MSVMYVVCPPDDTGWHVNLTSFVQALAARWPEARINVPASTADLTSAVTWTITSQQSPQRWLDGSLDQAGQASYLRGHPDLVADYALWLRAAHPEPQLVIVSDADGELLHLLLTTTAEEVIQFIS